MSLWKKLFLGTMFNASITMLDRGNSVHQSLWLDAAFSMLTYGMIVFHHWMQAADADVATERDPKPSAQASEGSGPGNT